MQGSCGKLSLKRKLKLRTQTQLPTTVRTSFPERPLKLLFIKANRPHTINTRSVNAAKVNYLSTVESVKTDFPGPSFAFSKARSINRKVAMICDIIMSNRLDIFAITETWLNSETNNVAIVEILTFQFFTFHAPTRKEVALHFLYTRVII